MDTLVDVGGGSVKNGQRYSLARIPLRWMIREIFKLNIGIIFDAHMLKHEVGLDVDSISEAPKPLIPAAIQLVGPNGRELGGALSKIPVAIISGLGAPFRWVRDKLPRLRLRDSPEVPF